jgi:hypothetical protein
MTDKADIILFTYSLIVVGFVIGAQMLYFGGVRKCAMDLGAKTIQPKQLISAGTIFASAGLLALMVMVAEILSGAAGTDLRPFIVATVVIPPVVLWFNGRAGRP